MAAASIASTGIVLEELRNDNYENWSTLVKNYLVGQGLWQGIVEGDSTISDEDMICKNGKALHAIQLSCGSKTLGQIRQFKTAKDVWNHLKASFCEDVKVYPDIEQGQDHDCDISKLHNDVKKGYWNDAKAYIMSTPDAIFQTSSSTGWTVLHVAVAAGQEKITEQLVEIGDQGLLRMQDKRGYTALALAAKLTDNKKIAELMINKGGEELLSIKSKHDDDDQVENIPLLLAAENGHKEMTRYLFSETPWSVLLEKEDDYVPKFLSGCISAKIFDVAAALLQHRVGQELPLNHNYDHLRPLYALAQMPSAFPSGIKLGCCSGLIYKILILQGCINFKDKNVKIGSHVEPDEGQQIYTLAGQIFERFQLFIQTYLLKISAIKKIHEMKMNNFLVLEILQSLCERVSTITRESDLHACSAYDSMLQASKGGIIEFINSMRQANPNLLWAIDKDKRGIFSHAILNRQEEVFRIIHETNGQKEIIVSGEDVFGNNMLHLAAELGFSSFLDGISNAALQMQIEIDWFTVIWGIVPAKCREGRNKDGKKPRELFTKTHEELMKASEKWAKDSASSFTIVAALILTIMFTAAFTVPGGYNQDTGIPIFFDQPAFVFFIMADQISLVASSISLLAFLRILTSRSRYTENDLYKRLVLKLELGFLALCISVVSMMCAFFAAVVLMHNKDPTILECWPAIFTIIPVWQLLPALFTPTFEVFETFKRYYVLTYKKKKSRD